MLNKLKQILSQKPNTAEQFEKKGKLQDAYKEYQRVGNHDKAGEILEKTGRWMEAAGIYIQYQNIEKARRAIEKCFKSGRSWERFRLDSGATVSIENWLKDNGQTRRFVRYVQDVESVSPQGMPLIILLADKLKKLAKIRALPSCTEKDFIWSTKEKIPKR